MLITISGILALGALGALLRFFFVSQFSGLALPFGTLFANVLGSFLIGALYNQYSQGHLGLVYYTILGFGFLGALTTFSSFSLEVLRLIQGGAWGAAAIYLVATNSLCLAACYAGMKFVGLR